MKPFTVVEPIEITDSNFVSSTLPETDYGEWSAVTTYTTGDRVIVAADHLIYQSATATNLNNTPDPNADTDDWLIVGATNRWKMFDDAGNTVSTGSAPIEFVVTGDYVDSMGFLGIEAETIRIQAEAGGDTYYDETFTMADLADIGDWAQYFFVASSLQTQLIVFDIPAVAGSTYTITLDAASTASLGTFIMGTAQSFGFTLYDAKVGIISYSKKQEDQFGNINIVRRLNRRTMDVQVQVDPAAFDVVNRALVDLDGKLALWVAADNDYEALTIYGFYRDFSQTLAYPTVTFANLQIEGLT